MKLELKIIIKWFNDNQGFMTSMISIVSTIGAVLAAFSAKRSRKESRNSEQKVVEASQNLTLFDKRVSIYNQVKYIIESEKNYKSALDKLFDIDVKCPRKYSLDKEFIQKKFELLFSPEIFIQYKELIDFISSSKSLNFDMDNYLQMVKESNSCVYDKIKKYILKKWNDQISNEEEEEFREFCQDSQISYSFSGNIEDQKVYNFHKLLVEKDNTDQIINRKEDQLYNSIDLFIKDRFI